MPDRRRHRGAHPEDERLFGASVQADLRAAVADLSLLMSRGYAVAAALKLVGDRFRLTTRQRAAVHRSACSDQDLAVRRQRRLDPANLGGQDLAVDGYNLLITVEAALGGAFLFRGRDGCLRDLAGVHGTYRRVAETDAAVSRVGQTLAGWSCGSVCWFLDQPVSNSGRLKMLLMEHAALGGWSWEVRLSPDPDGVLITWPGAVATADSLIVGRCRAWVDLAGAVVAEHCPEARVVDCA